MQHKIKKAPLRAALIAIAALPALAAGQWPEQPINLIIMYAPGGGTDIVLRTLVAEMAAATGWRINAQNRPGAAGALATRYAVNRPADGYTWLGASSFNKYSRVAGGSDSRAWTDWYYMQAATAIGSWAVRPDAPYRTFDTVIAAARERPGEITISTSGAGGQWHELAAVVADLAGVELRYVPYGSGQQAALAGLNGEVDIAGGGVHEHIQFVDSGQFISLQQSSASDITTPGGKTMPALSRFLPGVRDRLPPNGTYNLGIRRDTPLAIIRQVETAFVAAVRSEAFQEVVAQRHFVSEIITGTAADRRAAELETLSAATFERLGIPGAQTAEELGLPAPDDFDDWWPPEEYVPLPNSAP